MNFRLGVILLVLHFNSQVMADKWRLSKSSDYQKKKLKVMDQMDKLKSTEAKKKPFSNKSSTLKQNPKKPSEPDSYLSDERNQLCQSVSENTVKNSLVKLAIVTHLVDDVSEFRQAIKALQNSVPKTAKQRKKPSGTRLVGSNLDRQMVRAKGGPTVKPHQGNFVGRSLGLAAPPFVSFRSEYVDGSNKISSDSRGDAGRGARWRRAPYGSYVRTMRADRRKGTSRNFGQVPTCYGWRYLTALDALTPDNSPDTEVLAESLSDMLDMRFADDIINIMEMCGNKVARTPAMCPPPPPSIDPNSSNDNPDSGVDVLVPCVEQCMMDNDCGMGELCCRNSCGGHHCLNLVRQTDKPCQKADAFMQCLYNEVDTQLCQ